MKDNMSPHAENSHNDANHTSLFTFSLNPSDDQAIGRGYWTGRMADHMYLHRHRSKHNVLVINNDLEYHFAPSGVVDEFLVKYHETSRARTVPYKVVVFEEGMLVNMGDSGVINWGWRGNFVRSGNKVVTFKPLVPGVDYQSDDWVAVKA